MVSYSEIFCVTGSKINAMLKFSLQASLFKLPIGPPVRLHGDPSGPYL